MVRKKKRNSSNRKVTAHLVINRGRVRARVDAVWKLASEFQPNGLSSAYFALDRSPRVRTAALNSIVAIDRSLAAVLARGLLQDDSSEVRSSAIDVLGELAEVRDQPAVLRMLNDPSWIVRHSAIASARKMQATSEALEDLVILLQEDPFPVVRWEAALAIGGLAGGAGQPVLRKALMRERVPLVRAAIRFALYRAGDKSQLAPVLKLLANRQLQRRTIVFSVVDPIKLEDADVPEARQLLAEVRAEAESAEAIADIDRFAAEFEREHGHLPRA